MSPQRLETVSWFNFIFAIACSRNQGRVIEASATTRCLDIVEQLAAAFDDFIEGANKGARLCMCGCLSTVLELYRGLWQTQRVRGAFWLSTSPFDQVEGQHRGHSLGAS